MNILEIWNQFKDCGAKIIPNINERYMVFMDVIENCPEDVKVQTYLLTHYKAYNTLNNTTRISSLTNNHKILRKLENEKISPQKDLPKYSSDLFAFYY